MTLCKACSILSHHQRNMCIGWNGRPERFEQQDLAWGGMKKVIAAEDMGDAHGDIIQHYRKLIAWNAIGAGNDEVAGDGMDILGIISGHPIMEADAC